MLERAIHQRWAADAGLAALLPAARLFTGLAPGGVARPYATLALLESRPTVRTSGGTRVEETLLRFSIWTSELESAQQIGLAVQHAFERRGFPLAEGVVRQLRLTNRGQQPQADGGWNLTLDFAALVETS